MTESALLLWGIGLLLLAVLLVAMEVIVPSGGLIAVLAAAAAVAAIVCFWRVDTAWGLAGLLAVMILAPLSLGFALKVWPHTYFGKRMILGGEDEDAAQRARVERQQSDELKKALIGARGEALSDLRPVGTARIEGERVEVLAEGGMIPAGTPIRVTAVDGNQIKVRRAV